MFFDRNIIAFWNMTLFIIFIGSTFSSSGQALYFSKQVLVVRICLFIVFSREEWV